MSVSSPVGNIAQDAGTTVTLTVTTDTPVLSSPLWIRLTCLLGSTITTSTYTAIISVGGTTTTVGVAVPTSYVRTTHKNEHRGTTTKRGRWRRGGEGGGVAHRTGLVWLLLWFCVQTYSSLQCIARYYSGDSRFASISAVSVTIQFNVVVGVSAVTRMSDTLPPPWMPRAYAAAATYGPWSLIIAGGMGSAGTGVNSTFNDVSRKRNATPHRSPARSLPVVPSPAAVCLSAACSRLCVCCLSACAPYVPCACVCCVCQVWVLSGNPLSWTFLGNAPWSPRSRSTLVSAAAAGSWNPFVLLGGRDANGAALGDRWLTSSIDNNLWGLASNYAVSPAREGAVSVVWRGLVFLIGGSSSTTPGSTVNYPTAVLSFSSASSLSMQYAAAPWVGRKYHGAVVMPDDHLYVFGGQTYSGMVLNDVWRLTDPTGKEKTQRGQAAKLTRTCAERTRMQPLTELTDLRVCTRFCVRCPSIKARGLSCPL